jgi:photosystem II stability/assembly factor-like uncharacterized protein
MQIPGADFMDGQRACLPGTPDANLKQGIFQTVDGGRAWMELSQLQSPDAVLYFHDLEIGWALNGIGAAGNLYYQTHQATDGGHTWTQLQVIPPNGPEKRVQGTIHVAAGESVSSGRRSRFGSQPAMAFQHPMRD